MALSPTQISNLQALAVSRRVNVCEYLRVDWATGQTRYYSTQAYHEVEPFTSIGITLEPRIINDKRNPFHEIELQPDLRTESVTIKFDDIDGDIRERFQTYGGGVQCEFFLYYADEDEHESLGAYQLQAPQVYGWQQTQAVATNGFRSRELFVPRRNATRECTRSVFGGLLPNLTAVETSICGYNRHLVGGTRGNFKTGTTPYDDCPGSLEDCIARLGEAGRHFGGFVTDVAAVVTDTRNYYLAVSRGNASNLKESIPVIFGKKRVNALQMLLFRPEVNRANPDRGWVSTLWLVAEGPVKSIYNFQVNDKMIEQMHLNFRLGGRAQAPTAYAPNVSNYSKTAHVFCRFGWVNAANTSPKDLNASCIVEGFNEVTTYTAENTFVKQYSDNRVWCLFELYSNHAFGLGYAHDRFWRTKWITAGQWTDQVVSHTVTFPDGETQTFISRRASLNAQLEGRAFSEQVEDICRTGGVSIPFERAGKFDITPLRTATNDELTSAKTFYDTGENANIIWRDGRPAIRLSQVPDNKLVNTVELRFEEEVNGGAERPIRVQDKHWQERAGRQLGVDLLLPVVKKYTGFGINILAEAVRVAYRLLKFGEFDSGGTDNNLRLEIEVPFEFALGLTRYEIIKIESELLDAFTIGLNDTEEQPEYFRVLQMRRTAGNVCVITAQAYNHTAYSAFEVDSALPVIVAPAFVSNAGSPLVNGGYEYAGQMNGKPSFHANPGNAIYWDGSKWGIYVGSDLYYESPDDTDYPWEAVWVIGTGIGIAPVPYVTEGEIIGGGGGCVVELGTPVYDPITGLLELPNLPC